MEGRSGLFKLV